MLVGYMTKFEKWMLRRIVKRLVIQSPCHPTNISDYYRIIQEAAQSEFFEDNKPTLDDFLRSRFEASLRDDYESIKNCDCNYMGIPYEKK